MIGRAVAVVLVGALLVSGCSVARLPETAAAREQTATQHRLDVADCKAEVGYRHNYNGDDSPLANALRNVFVLGTSGAALGGFLTGLPTTVAASTPGAVSAWTVTVGRRCRRQTSGGSSA